MQVVWCDNNEQLILECPCFQHLPGSFLKLCFLRHKLKQAPPITRLAAYYSFICSELKHACIVWDPYSQCNIDALEKVQRKAPRFIFSKNRSTDSQTSLTLGNNIQTLQFRRIDRINLFFVKQPFSC